METDNNKEEKNAIRVVETVNLPQDLIENMLTCPVSLCLFKHPVVLIGSGQTVEEDMACFLLEENNPICPITRNKITGYEPNFIIQSILDDYLRVYPGSKEDQYGYEAQDEIASEVASEIQSDTEAQRDNNNNSEEAAQDNLSHFPLRRMSSIEFFSPEGERNDFVENTKYAIPIAIFMSSNPQAVNPLGEGEKYSLKCLCVGDSDSGKSTFMMNLARAQGLSHLSTIGVDYKFVEQEDCRFQVWDNSGQERFGTITSAYYRGCHFVLVFASTEAINTGNIWVNDAIKNLPDDYKLHWIKNNAGEVEFVSCNELPIVEIKEHAFVSPQLLASKDQCHQISQDILSLARERILMVQDLNADNDNNNNALPEQQNDNGKRNCLVM